MTIVSMVYFSMAILMFAIFMFTIYKFDDVREKLQSGIITYGIMIIALSLLWPITIVLISYVDEFERWINSFIEKYKRKKDQ